MINSRNTEWTLLTLLIMLRYSLLNIVDTSLPYISLTDHNRLINGTMC
jgi:hypothetical protein